MSIEENKQNVLKFYDALQAQDYDECAKYIDEDFCFFNQIDHPYPGIEGLAQAEKPTFDAFPNFVFPVEKIAAEGDNVFCYMRFEGDHTGGDFGTLPATGKHVRVSICMYLKMKDGKILEKHAHYNAYDWYQQLGVDLDGYIASLR